jgi:hypothetical protein
MTVAPIAARAAAGTGARAAGAGKVIDVTPTASRPLRASNVRTRGARASDVASGAGLGQLAAPGRSGRGGSSPVLRSSARRVLVAEFALCMVVLAFSPITDTAKAEGPGAFMKRASATMGVFFVLGLIATAGRGAARAAAGFGGLMTLVLLISNRSVFSVLATKFGAGVGEKPQLGEIIEDIVEDAKDGEFDGDSEPEAGAVPLIPKGAGIR